jgi:hypothetical protein
VEEWAEQPYFEEEQDFALWIKAIVLLPVVVLCLPAIVMWWAVVVSLRDESSFLPGAIIFAISFTALALILLLLAVATLKIKLVTRLDSSHLHLRIYPLKLPVPFLPPRIKDVSLSDISHWEVRTYRALSDKEYWGTHFFSLGSAFGGRRYLYVMKASLTSARGVQLQLRSGERLLIGSEHPEELNGAITLAKSESS